MNIVKSEQIIIDFIERHTLATDRCLPVADRNRATFTIDQLVRKQRISQWTHRSGMRYWTAPSGRPLADKSLVRALAIAFFCSESAQRSLISRSDIETYFPTLFRHGLPSGFYIYRGEQSTRLGHVRVDGGESRVNRIVARTFRLVDKFRQQVGFHELIRSRQFELTWVVPTLTKQRRLAAGLQSLTMADLRVNVVAIPELLNVIAPITPGVMAEVNELDPHRV